MTITMSVPKGSTPMTEAQAESEHEFEAANGDRYRVRWDFALDSWTLCRLMKTEWRYPWPVESHLACAAEIARLKGLVPPGVEGES